MRDRLRSWSGLLVLVLALPVSAAEFDLTRVWIPAPHTDRPLAATGQQFDRRESAGVRLGRCNDAAIRRNPGKQLTACPAVRIERQRHHPLAGPLGDQQFLAVDRPGQRPTIKSLAVQTMPLVAGRRVEHQDVAAAVEITEHRNLTAVRAEGRMEVPGQVAGQADRLAGGAIMVFVVILAEVLRRRVGELASSRDPD